MRVFYILMIILAVTCIRSHAQTVTGRITDTDSGEPLIGATVEVEGRSEGGISDDEGRFSVLVPEVPAVLKISYLGYQSERIPVLSADRDDLGIIRLRTATAGLEEIIVTGVMDIVQDRRTPVAVSTIGRAELETKATGDILLPEVARSTPSVHVVSQSGGYGEGEVFTRGFDQTNTAFLLNGQPVNGMEDGKIYWVNWSGLADVASVIQIQRGLGASKLAISSVGGTWNFVMKATDTERGGNVYATVGNDHYNKTGASWNSGLIDDKWGVSVLFARWSGSGWAHGTPGRGQTYFISGGYKPAPRHRINLLLTGAPQSHDQNFGGSLRSHLDAEGRIDPKFNRNWGIYDGRYLSERTNYYHKPVVNLNWDWDINERSAFSAVFYGSMGRGGGTGGLGDEPVRTSSGLIDFDATAADPDRSYIIRSSVNNHNWFGGVVKYERELGENFHGSFGSDLRHYYGDHFQQVFHLMGQDGYRQFGTPAFPDGYTARREYKANAWAATSGYAPRGDRIGYNSAETIRYQGIFGQIEYDKKDFSAYVQGALSAQSHVRHEYFYEKKADQDSEKIINGGYNIKTGLSYSLKEYHVLFANAGKYSRQPFHTAVFSGNSNVPDDNIVNEDIESFEIGYKWSAPRISAHVNLYRTAWNNRVFLNPLEVNENGMVRLTSGEWYEAEGRELYELLFQNQLHTGAEADVRWRINDHLRWKGMLSVGRWEVIGDREVEVYDGVTAFERVLKYMAEGENIKVGGAPQTSGGMGVEWKIIPALSAEAFYYFNDRLYARNGGIRLPSYGLLDLHLSYTLPLKDEKLIRFTGNVWNALGKIYISQSFSSVPAGDGEENHWNGIHLDNSVIFGKTRTMSFSMKYYF